MQSNVHTLQQLHISLHCHQEKSSLLQYSSKQRHCRAIIDPLLGPAASTKQEAPAFVYSTDLQVRQRLVDPWSWRTDQPTICNKTEVAPHTECSVTISEHCKWHISWVAHALRQPSSVLMWHCQYLTVQTEFTTRGLDFEYILNSYTSPWRLLVGAPSMHTVCHACMQRAQKCHP